MTLTDCEGRLGSLFLPLSYSGTGNWHWMICSAGKKKVTLVLFSWAVTESVNPNFLSSDESSSSTSPFLFLSLETLHVYFFHISLHLRMCDVGWIHPGGPGNNTIHRRCATFQDTEFILDDESLFWIFQWECIATVKDNSWNEKAVRKGRTICHCVVEHAVCQWT